MDTGDEWLTEQLRLRRAERLHRERLEREVREREKTARARVARRRLLIAAVVLLAPAAVWAGRSAAVPLLGWAGTGTAAALLWIGLAAVLTASGGDRWLAGFVITPFLGLFASAILVGDVRPPQTVTLAVTHVSTGRYASITDDSGRTYDVPHALRDELHVGRTYRCTGQARPVLGLYLQRCRPLRRPAA